MRLLIGVGDVEDSLGVQGDGERIASWALPAGPLSPPKPTVPLPATVVICPPEPTLRIRWFQSVGDSTVLPSASTATPTVGRDNRALVDEPLSPAEARDAGSRHGRDQPARDLARCRLFSVSAIYRLPLNPPRAPRERSTGRWWPGRRPR